MNTPNLAKKILIQVVGYEEEKHEDNETALYSEQSEGGDVEVLNTMQSNGDREHHRSDDDEGRSAKFDVEHVQMEVLVVMKVNGIPNVSNPHRCMDPRDIRGPTSQNFQTQLDDIDAELARFDGGKELGKKVRVGRGSGEGDSMEKSIGGLRNFPLQSDSGSTPSIIPAELFSLKRPREVSSEEMGLANDSRKKQVLVVKTQSVETDVQPHRQP